VSGQVAADIEADGVAGLQTWAIPVRAAGQTIADLCGVPAAGAGWLIAGKHAGQARVRPRRSRGM
jgi:hypothetical protein